MFLVLTPLSDKLERVALILQKDCECEDVLLLAEEGLHEQLQGCLQEMDILAMASTREDETIEMIKDRHSKDCCEMFRVVFLQEALFPADTGPKNFLDALNSLFSTLGIPPPSYVLIGNAKQLQKKKNDYGVVDVVDLPLHVVYVKNAICSAIL